MKSFKITGVCCMLLMLAVSCAAGKASIQKENEQTETVKYKNIKQLDGSCTIKDFPAVFYNILPDKLVRSFFLGAVVNDAFLPKDLDIFADRLIGRVGANYVLYGEKHEIAYYVMAYGFSKEISDGASVVPGDIIGRVDNGRPGILAFSETPDPYLVLNSNSPPVFYAGYYWFDPSFLSSAGPGKWICFDPVDNINARLKEIAGQMTEESPGLSVMRQPVRFKTSLSEYPREMSAEERKSISVYETLMYGRQGIVTHITEMNADGCDYLLCWQTGFQNYLKKEYAPGNDIWLYGFIVTYDVWSKKGYVFLRDFTLMSPEEIYEGRLKELRG
ncbi:MAG: hypothetical protein FWC45_06695 [Treponema sp.]|nr:hypothetical protein [Treponema sp.]